jgi:hypothetical protein
MRAVSQRGSRCQEATNDCDKISTTKAQTQRNIEANRIIYNYTDLPAREGANLSTAMMASEVSHFRSLRISPHLILPHTTDFSANNIDEQAVPIPERKARKSVAFSEGTSIVDENGVVTMKEDEHDDSKNTALSHSTSMFIDSQLRAGFADNLKATTMLRMQRKKMMLLIC